MGGVGLRIALAVTLNGERSEQDACDRVWSRRPPPGGGWTGFDQSGCTTTGSGGSRRW
jgi:hypothetical protein